MGFISERVLLGLGHYGGAVEMGQLLAAVNALSQSKKYGLCVRQLRLWRQAAHILPIALV